MLPCQSIEPFEAAFFRVLNAFIEPLVRAGVGSPGWWPTGAIVLETTGRKTGRTFNVPVLATLVGDLVLVATVRHRSQWLKNLSSNPDLRYWVGGQVHDATAFVVGPGLPLPRGVMPPLAESLASGLVPLSAVWGVSFAILTSGPEGRGRTSSPDRIARQPAAPADPGPVVRGQDAWPA
jgi:F420H(2)-dependent quinone reductase